MKVNKEYTKLLLLFLSIFAFSFLITNGIRILIFGKTNIISYTQVIPVTTAPDPTRNSLQMNTFKFITVTPKPKPIVQTENPLGASGCDPGPSASEPPADYKRISFHGVTVNVRTKLLIETAEKYAKSLNVPTPFRLMQGSYHTGVGASAGTHDGGGVVDISVSGMNLTQKNNTVKALRMAGFAAWLRGAPFVPHIHANAIGDKEMSAIAKEQVKDYFGQKNGLSGHCRDSAPASVGRPAPSWTAKYGTCVAFIRCGK